MSKLKFKGAPVHTNSEPPALGSPAPDFTLTDANLRDYPLS
jgi:peroxiredoxin